MSDSVIPIVLASLVALVLLFAVAWRHLPEEARRPLAVYLGSYAMTYLIGGLWIGLTDGDALVDYFKDRLYVPTVGSLGAMFWVVLLAPVAIPVAMLPFYVRIRARASGTAAGAPQRWRMPEPGLVGFALAFAGLSAAIVYNVFGSGSAVLNVLSTMTALNGDTSTIIERRFALFGGSTTATFGMLYSALPALCHVALFKARTPGWRWRLAAGVAIAVTLTLSFATYQIGLATVLIVALMLSAWHLQMLRITSLKLSVYALSVLVLTHFLNQWKFAQWTFGENMQHLLLRMPSAYLYYLECFPGTVPFLGSDWLGSLTGHGVDPATPFVIARYMYPDAISGAAMAAPAHVQAYAEGGVLNALFAVGAVAIIVALAGKLYRRSREGAVMHAAYIQALVALYYLTQTSFRGAIWHSYGYVWSAGALAVLAVLSWRPSPSMAALRVKPVMMTPRVAARVG